MEPALLLAIVAPGSVEAGIGKVQEAIFADHGLLSAAALPPLIPVAFVSGARSPRLLGTVERSARAPWLIRTTGLAWESGFLYLAVGSGGLWQTLVESARPAAEPAPLFPVFEGFFAGCGEAPAEKHALIRPAVPELVFSSASLAVLAIRSPRGRDAWWREVTWEMLEEKPLRGRREG